MRMTEGLFNYRKIKVNKASKRLCKANEIIRIVDVPKEPLNNTFK